MAHKNQSHLPPKVLFLRKKLVTPSDMWTMVVEMRSGGGATMVMVVLMKKG